MNKFFGNVGYCTMVETAPSVWEEQILERKYSGDILRLSRRLQTADHANDDVVISSQISIIADPYAYKHFHEIRYVEVWDIKWKVTNIDVQYPRLTLTLGEEYHGTEQIGTGYDFSDYS